MFTLRALWWTVHFFSLLYGEAERETGGFVWFGPSYSAEVACLRACHSVGRKGRRWVNGGGGREGGWGGIAKEERGGEVA